MPRRALRCVVDLQLHALSAPGVWLPSKEDVYLSISMFSQYRNTRLQTSVFPLLIHEKFVFEKTYYTAVDPSQVAELLEDELIIFELLQLSEYSDGAVRLASFSTNARDFLYPYPTLAPSYSAHEREILLCRTIAFPGISPKLEFSTKTVIKESISPELDALDDALDMERRSRSKTRRSRIRARTGSDQESNYEDENTVDEGERKSRRRSRSESRGRSVSADGRKRWAEKCPPHYTMPTVSSLSRSRSASPTPRRRLADITLDSTIDPRPPFVVRKLDSSLIGRTPSATEDALAKSKQKRSASPYRSTSPYRSPTRSALYGNYTNSASPTYRVSKVIREPYTDPLPVYKPRYNDIDSEVAALTSYTPSTYVPVRPRSVSPIVTRSSFLDRYGYYWPYTSAYYARLAAERDLELARLRRLRLSNTFSSYYSSLDDLDLELRLARIRAARYC
ncbi:spermatogenesis-associated protein 6-like [Plakobranchus ocellatus]|uniref:Spermatogenesis-associated protein 6-like n=1 Tax=Plakobranchus ocellatus TaxID=259542 RepID=A0AAV3ZRX4_9GAST|nr:spermatogenesis-associated protein 6-like [Plakobranchus ocellatus]